MVMIREKPDTVLEGLQRRRRELMDSLAEIRNELRDCDDEIAAHMGVEEPEEWENWDKLLPVLSELAIQEERLPWVGFRYFKQRRVGPAVDDLSMTDETAHRILQEFIEEGLVEVYYVPNHQVGRAYPTAALRLTEEGREELSHAQEESSGDHRGPGEEGRDGNEDRFA